MKTWILFLLVLSTSCARQIVDNELIVGDGSGADVTITADVGNVNNPKIEYDFATGNWRFSNNGVDYDVFGSAASDVLNTNGDLLYFNSGYQRRAIGTEGQLLTVVSGLPTWADAPVSTTLDTKGQLQGYSTVNAAVGPCTDGQTLVYDATEATGWKCGIALPDQTGQSGEFLFTNGTDASWTRVDDRLNQVKNNLLANGGFDSVGVASEYVVVTDAVTDLTSVLSRVGEVSANNLNMLNIEATNGDASPYDIKAVFTKSQDFNGKQMLAFCEVKTLRPDTFFIVGANGVEQSRREVINDGSWRYYEIPFVGGDTSQYIEINGETTASQEAISVDNCFMGKVSPEIAIAEGLPSLSKGSLITSDGSNNGELVVGTDGQILAADSTETSGLKWIDAPSGGGGSSFTRPQGVVEWYQEFQQFGTQTTSASLDNMYIGLSGTGSSVVGVLNNAMAKTGGVRLFTGTTTTGSALLEGMNTFNTAIERVTIESKLGAETLSDGTQAFEILFGSFTGAGNFNLSTITYGIFFAQVHSQNGGRWMAITENNNVSTTVDTGISMVANTSYTLRIEIDYSIPEAKFYINNSLVATITSNIAHPAVGFHRSHIKMIKTAGTTSRAVIVDYFYVKAEEAY